MPEEEVQYPITKTLTDVEVGDVLHDSLTVLSAPRPLRESETLERDVFLQQMEEQGKIIPPDAPIVKFTVLSGGMTGDAIALGTETVDVTENRLPLIIRDNAEQALGIAAHLMRLVRRTAPIRGRSQGSLEVEAVDGGTYRYEAVALPNGNEHVEVSITDDVGDSTTEPQDITAAVRDLLAQAAEVQDMLAQAAAAAMSGSSDEGAPDILGIRGPKL